MEGTQTDLPLNFDVWCYIFDILIVDDLSFAVSCSLVCKEINRILTSESLWKLKCSIPIPGIKVYTKLPSKITTWFDLFKQKVYLTRHIPVHVVSKFDVNYHCTISKVKLTPQHMTLYIDERGNNSLGNIQQPTLSRLFVGVPGGGVSTLPLSTSKFSIADPAKQFLGKLVYDVEYSLENVYFFEYGVGGYSRVIVIFLDAIWANKYNMQPILRAASKI